MELCLYQLLRETAWFWIPVCVDFAANSSPSKKYHILFAFVDRYCAVFLLVDYGDSAQKQSI